MARIITNIATLNYRSGEVARTSVSNVAQATIEEAIRLTKTAYEESYRPGDTLTYVLQIISEEENPTALSVVDDLGSYSENGQVYTPLSYESYLLFVGQEENPEVGGVAVTVTVQTNGVRFDLDNIPTPFPGLTLIYKARVNEFAPPYEEESVIRNTARLFAGEELLSSDSAVVTAEAFAEVRILKSITPDPIRVGDAVLYTILLCNYGTSVPTDVTLRDVFSPRLQIPLSVTVDGAMVDSFDYNFATGEFVLGSEATEAYTLQIPAATTERDEETGQVRILPGRTVVTVEGVVVV